MRRSISVLLVASLALGASLSGCGTSAQGDRADDGAKIGADNSAPAGVVDQYDALDAEVAERGGSTMAGDWQVSYIVEASEPWFEAHGEHQRFRPAAGTETHHIEIIPREAGTGRIVPDVPITLEVLDETGNVVDSQRLNFYYSTFFHYANNFSVPASGDYTLRAALGAPTFHRHGEQGEQAPLSEGVTVSFDDVELARG